MVDDDPVAFPNKAQPPITDEARASTVQYVTAALLRTLVDRGVIERQDVVELLDDVETGIMTAVGDHVGGRHRARAIEQAEAGRVVLSCFRRAIEV